MRPGKAVSFGMGVGGPPEIMLVIQRVQTPPGQRLARQAGSEPCYDAARLS